MIPHMASTSSKAHDEAVQATNDDAFESKVAAMEKGYFIDPILAEMGKLYKKNKGIDVQTCYSRPPIINRGTFARILLKKTLVEAFLTTAAPQKVQIISLGAGFDTFPFSLFKNLRGYPPFHYVELDFSTVISEKIRLSENALAYYGLFSNCWRSSNSFRGIAKRRDHFKDPATSSISPNRNAAPKYRSFLDQSTSVYSLHTCDLRDISMLETVLKTLAIDLSLPTLFLTEIVLVYMQPTHSDALIQYMADSFTGLRAFVNLEHISSHAQFGEQMQRNIAARGSPLLGLSLYPTLETQLERFRRRGWAFVTTESMLSSFEKRFCPSDVSYLQRIEPLDELEEWRLLMGHYCVLLAVNGNGAEAMLKNLDLLLYRNSPIR